ncbi:hypothetical protein KLEB273_gp205 [Bacillus phage vB_BauM_KLEB27-3]|nr:hypothetical protein KLEB273_gp205 [Bacillus phage vB_BauM_KLEB27-3]
MLQRGFHHLSKARYAQAILKKKDIEDAVTFGFYHSDGSTSGEIQMEWINIHGESFARIKVFSDAFSILNQFIDVIEALNNKEHIQPKEFTLILKNLGFVDLTETK